MATLRFGVGRRDDVTLEIRASDFAGSDRPDAGVLHTPCGTAARTRVGGVPPNTIKESKNVVGSEVDMVGTGALRRSRGVI
jgi:hypothetical protein